MACGAPVVAADCEYGPREIVEDGETGLLVRVDDADSLAHGHPPGPRRSGASRVDSPSADACEPWTSTRPQSPIATRTSCTRPPPSCVIGIRREHSRQGSSTRAGLGRETCSSLWQTACFTLWEQARGRRRRHAALRRPAEPDGSRRAHDGPVATVVLLSWQRPSNVRTILDAYTRYRRIAEIIVWNNNPDLPFTYDHAKVRLGRTAASWGSTRAGPRPSSRRTAASSSPTMI